MEQSGSKGDEYSNKAEEFLFVRLFISQGKRENRICCRGGALNLRLVDPSGSPLSIFHSEIRLNTVLCVHEGWGLRIKSSIIFQKLMPQTLIITAKEQENR